MRKVIGSVFVSLDGVMQAPGWKIADTTVLATRERLPPARAHESWFSTINR